jgi:hypothetical protein
MPENHAVSFEDLSTLSKNSYAIIHRRVHVMRFYSWGDAANLQNRELRTREKRDTSVFVR